MTRLIERWFPCKEVSENSRSGWGSGKSEKTLFPWFASRSLVQAKAAVICSLLPWPDDQFEQERLKDLVRRALAEYDAAHSEIVSELNKYYTDGASLLDSFSGRGMIPLEAARLGIKSWGIDYSPVATLAGKLLADYPMRDWLQDPPLPFDDYDINQIERLTFSRLLYDVQFVLNLIGKRYTSEMDIFYPKVNGKRPWGYLWAITLPCVNCGSRFPVTGSYELRKPNHKKDDLGQSYYIQSSQSDFFQVVVHNGVPRYEPTLINKKGSKGKVAVCPFCDHVHAHNVHTRLRGDKNAQDALLVVADVDEKYGKSYRKPVQVEIESIQKAIDAIRKESPFALDLPAIPNEKALGYIGAMKYTNYGYDTFGDLCNFRQTLGLIKLSRIINDIGVELLNANVSSSYVATLSGYASSVLCRKIRMSTRGAVLLVTLQATSDIFRNGPPNPFGSDYFETGCGEGPGTWYSLVNSTMRTLARQLNRVSGRPAHIQQGTATILPFKDTYFDAVVIDPPYDAMVEYSDASDIFFVWLKRSLAISYPEFGITSNSVGVQDKADEAVVEKTWRSGDHRNPDHYRRSITKALDEARRVITSEGVVVIMFGHDNPDVWKRFLTAINDAGLVLTGSWPARTEKGEVLNRANIETTLTLACRASAPNRPVGDMLKVDNQVRQEIVNRISLWQDAGLAFKDQRMASYGPAMEIVGRYSMIKDKSGEVVGLDQYLAKARRYVEETAEILIGKTPLEVFDLRTKFGLLWARMYGRSIVPGSEVRWLRLGWDMKEDDTDGLLVKIKQGFRLAYADEIAVVPNLESAIIDIAFAVATVGKSIKDIADILTVTNSAKDNFLWETMNEIATQVPNTDRDGDIWTWAVRNRNIISGVSHRMEDNKIQEEKEKQDTGDQQVMI